MDGGPCFGYKRRRLHILRREVRRFDLDRFEVAKGTKMKAKHFFFSQGKIGIKDTSA
jgi:hypothetical protein